jgi:hypothetical protein
VAPKSDVEFGFLSFDSHEALIQAETLSPWAMRSAGSPATDVVIKIHPYSFLLPLFFMFNILMARLPRLILAEYYNNSRLSYHTGPILYLYALEPRVAGPLALEGKVLSIVAVRRPAVQDPEAHRGRYRDRPCKGLESETPTYPASGGVCAVTSTRNWSMSMLCLRFTYCHGASLTCHYA